MQLEGSSNFYSRIFCNISISISSILNLGLEWVDRQISSLEWSVGVIFFLDREKFLKSRDWSESGYRWTIMNESFANVYHDIIERRRTSLLERCPATLKIPKQFNLRDMRTCSAYPFSISRCPRRHRRHVVVQTCKIARSIAVAYFRRATSRFVTVKCKRKWRGGETKLIRYRTYRKKKKKKLDSLIRRHLRSFHQSYPSIKRWSSFSTRARPRILSRIFNDPISKSGNRGTRISRCPFLH